MITPNEQALELAARALREKALKRVGESIEIFRGFRKVEEHRLRMWHHAGGGGREVARQRSDLVDILFKELFEGVVRSVVPKGLSEPLVITALGGYGRRELMPFSDIDIMFTTANPQPSRESEDVIRKTLTDALGYWLQGRPFHPLDLGNHQARQCRHGHQNFPARIALSERRPGALQRVQGEV